MNPQQPTPEKVMECINLADEKVENGRLAVAHFQGADKEDVIVTYWGNNGVCERACYLLEKVGDGYNTHLQHMETGTYNPNGATLSCYDNEELPPRLKENIPAIQKMLEGMLSE